MTPTERLPDVVKIAGFDFRIEKWDNHAASAAQRYGECSTIEQTIRIQRSFSSPYKAIDTVLHEFLHAIMWVYGVEDEDKEERIVGVLGTGLMTLHRDNPWLAGWITETLSQGVVPL